MQQENEVLSILRGHLALNIVEDPSAKHQSRGLVLHRQKRTNLPDNDNDNDNDNNEHTYPEWNLRLVNCWVRSAGPNNTLLCC